MSDHPCSNRSEHEVILSDYPYKEYANLSEAYKRTFEPTLLAKIMRSSNLDLDNKHFSVEACSNLLRDNPQVRNLLLDGWKNGTFQLVRESGV